MKRKITTEIRNHRGDLSPRAPHFGVWGFPTSAVSYLCGHIFFFLFLPLCLLAVESPEEIQKELDSAEAQFERAKGMFNPWYAGPLVTPSASMMPPGYANIQPYFFLNGAYASFNEDRKSMALPHNLYSASIISPIQIGVTTSTDIVVSPPSAVANWQDGNSGCGFGDLGITYGFSIFKETLYIPKFKFTIGETFPTGKYQKLKSTGLNGTGAGSFQTQFGLAMGKVIWWTYPHVVNTRLFVGYTIATVVDVSGFNAYGGGYGTDGRVRPGNKWTVDLGGELTLTQHWVLAMDFVYVAQNQTKFHGHPGISASGEIASVGSGYNDNFSLAPAIEYNFNDSLAILWGVQFSVYGRNSSNFINGQFSVEYTW